MTKINRRDFLSKMGLGILGLGTLLIPVPKEKEVIVPKPPEEVKNDPFVRDETGGPVGIKHYYIYTAASTNPYYISTTASTNGIIYTSGVISTL